jgi:lysophospholipase L1-like esterase
MLAHVPQQRSFHWFIPASASLAAGAALATGCLLALTSRFGQPMAPLPARTAAAPSTTTWSIVALGDSITQGTGDDRGGYAARVAAALRREGKEEAVTFTNLAVAGLETNEILATVSAPEARRQLASATLVLLSAGGNDLSHGLRRSGPDNDDPARDGDGDSSDSPFPPAATRLQAQRNLTQILTQLQTLAPHATVRLLGLYNPFGVQPADAPAARAQLRAQLRVWNDMIETAAVPFDNVVVVPVADLFAARGDLLAGDRYHPGPKGHELIADRVLATLPESPP